MSESNKSKKKDTLTAYLVIKVQLEVDATQTDQSVADHHEEILSGVADQLDYTVTFDDKLLHVGSLLGDAIEIPVKITNTEVVALLNTKPDGV
jgi:hypothetical protein